jgi:hypothetical protein
MIGGTARGALQRALEISHELAAIADTGDVESAQRLDAERLQLLKFARGVSQRLDDADRQMLQEITELNDKAIGFLEHRRRCTARDLDMISVGKRALRAYSANRPYR